MKDPKKRKHRGRDVWLADWEDALTGQRHRNLFNLKRDADAFLEKVAAAPKFTHTLSPLVDPAVRLDAFTASWFWDRMAAPGKRWRPSTARTYADHVLGRLLPCRYGNGPDDVLGRTKVCDLTARHVAMLVESMSSDGFSPNTIKLTVVIFGTLLQRATSRGLLPASPLTRDLRRDLAPYLTPDEDGPDKAFTREQAQAFLRVTAQHSRLHPLYVTGFTAGLRLGELLGLQLDDLRGRLRVARSLDIRGSALAPVVGPTKGGRERQVDVCADLRAVLDQIASDRPKLALRHAWRPVPPWTFITGNGTVFSQRAVRTDFRHMLQLAGLGDTSLTPHGMRHTFTREHVQRRCNLPWLQQQLGHKSIEVTIGVYAKYATVTDTAAADDLGSSLLGNDTPAVASS